MSASEPVPSSREFTFVGIAYGLHVTGLFLFWPALIGIVLDYIKRGDVEGTVLESHYRWLIRTFWWSLLWGIVVLGAMLTVIIPEAAQVAGLARSGHSDAATPASSRRRLAGWLAGLSRIQRRSDGTT